MLAQGGPFFYTVLYMQYPRVAIIVLNYNNESYTIDCLESLKSITYPNYKIFLVENGSEKKSVQALKFWLSTLPTSTFKGFEMLEVYPNVGFSGGNNVGIKKAFKDGFEYIFLLNNDTAVEPDFLEPLVKVAQSDKTVGVVGPKIYFHPDMIKNDVPILDGTTEEALGHPKDLLKQNIHHTKKPLFIWYAGGAFSWFSGSKHLQYEEIDEHPHETATKEVEFVTGCAFLIRNDVIEKVGFMPEAYYLYYEDTDWSLAVRKAGYKLIYAPASKIYHKVSRTTKKLGNPMLHYYHSRNALLLAKRQAPKPIFFMILAMSWYTYAKQVLKLFIKPSTRKESRMIMRGIEDFYKNNFGRQHA